MDSSRSAPSTGKKNSAGAGLLALLFKVGGKLFGVLAKLLKMLKFGKAAMLGASFAAYGVLFSWQFAAVLITSLFVHECGHIWAMKRHGLRTKGVYFIPLLGAAAVSEDAFPSRKAEVEIALMGPLWGFGLALATYALYLATGSVLIASLAGWMAMLNLFNLLPINPLDGGRVMKSIAYSIHSKLGFWFLTAGLVGCFFLANKFGLGLITFLMVIGALELLGEIRNMRRVKDREAILAEMDCMAAFAPEISDRRKAVIEGIARAHSIASNGGVVDESLLSGKIRDHYHRNLVLSGASGSQIVPEEHVILLEGYELDAAIARVANDACQVRRGWFTGKIRRDTTCFGALDVIKALSVQDMPTMTPGQTGISFLAYAGLATGLAALMFAVEHIPAAQAALHVFIG
jgi:Zn-dependent protease